MDFQPLLRAVATSNNLKMVRVGLEREGQRVTPDGQLATTDFKTVGMDRVANVTRDFAETQLELVTPVATSTAQALRELTTIQREVVGQLNPRELIWPLSTPPQLPVDEQQIVIAKLANRDAVTYRQYLAQHYGRRRQMLSGLHFNFELAPQLVTAMFARQNEYGTLAEFRNALYLHVAQNYLRYRWLITYRYGATPTSWPNLYVDQKQPKEPVRSLRNSRYGYVNAPDVRVSYQSLNAYLVDLVRLVQRGRLSEEKEFYGHVRLRGGHRVLDLATTGIEYLEIRHLDLNPYAPVGINRKQLAFVHAFLLLMLWLPAPRAVDEAVKRGDGLNESVALQRPWERPNALREGRWLMQQLAGMLAQLPGPTPTTVIADVTRELNDPAQTLAARWWRACQTTDPTELAVQLAERHGETLLDGSGFSGKG
ncbi:hypothetical protein D1831_04145 [Lactiplantibacillus garii]|uniref:Glutamate--cysteine ligase n=1 Tax=Lactiplantibacillus garii TaxID=2306423 RepID=A0A426D984_9LACO|nr:hypothetical protein [Lactiplantibacillus garii]RRK11143.1 hypothetical protein D1831_04145 [Lactiplantibacillus garii]